MPLVWKQHRDHFVNSVAISNDGRLAVAGTYYFPYPSNPNMPPLPQRTEGRFGTYCFDAQGKELWRDEYNGNEGIYSVAVSGNGQVVAGGGLLSGGKMPADPATEHRCLIRAFSADGRRMLDYSNLSTRVNSVGLDRDGTVLAGVTIAGEMVVFARQGGSFAPAPTIPVTAGARLDMIAVHPGGKWLVAAGWRGTVHLVTLDNGAVRNVYTWNAQTPGPKFLACAIARSGNRFIVGGQNRVYLFTHESMTGSGGPQPVGEFETPGGGTSDDVRWLAMSGDGSLVSVVQNLGHDIAGLLLTLSCDGRQLKLLRPPQRLNFNPNSTSMNDAGTLITVADGHPVKAPGTFYVFRASDGQMLMEVPTVDMNWPMVISADGGAICAGSDDLVGDNIFYLTP